MSESIISLKRCQQKDIKRTPTKDNGVPRHAYIPSASCPTKDSPLAPAAGQPYTVQRAVHFSLNRRRVTGESEQSPSSRAAVHLAEETPSRRPRVRASTLRPRWRRVSGEIRFPLAEASSRSQSPPYHLSCLALRSGRKSQR